MGMPEKNLQKNYFFSLVASFTLPKNNNNNKKKLKQKCAKTLKKACEND